MSVYVCNIICTFTFVFKIELKSILPKTKTQKRETLEKIKRKDIR